jgi:phage gpG-like protein
MAKMVRKIKGINFRRKINVLKKANSRLPRIIAVTSKEFFRDSFRNQGFTNRTLVRWQERKPNPRNRGRAILVQSGRLSKLRILRSDWRIIEIGTLLPYGKYHNQGIGRMPRRKFIGRSVTLNKQIRKIIHQEYNKVIRA